MELTDNVKRKKRTKTDKSKVPPGEREGKVHRGRKAVVGKRVCWELGVVTENQCGSYGTNSVLSLLPVDPRCHVTIPVNRDRRNWPCLETCDR